MKKIIVIVSIVLATIAVLSVAGLAYAQTQTPPVYGQGIMGGSYGRGGRGPGMMGGFGPGMMGGTFGEEGPMHEYMVDAFAAGLDLTSADIESRLDAGESMYDIAISQGFSAEQFTDLMNQAHSTALEQAVANGVITQEQADFMDERMGGAYGYGAGLGCGAYNGTGQRGPGGRWNNTQNP